MDEKVPNIPKDVKEKRNLLWFKVEKKRHVDKDAIWVKAQIIKALEPNKRGGVGGELNIYTGEATCIKEHASLKDDTIEEICQRYLNKLISIQIVLDTFYGKDVKEVMLYFLEDGRKCLNSKLNIYKLNTGRNLSMYYIFLSLRIKCVRDGGRC